MVLLNCSFHAIGPSERADVLTVAYDALCDGGELQLHTCCSSRRLSPAFCSVYSAKLLAHGSSLHRASGSVTAALTRPIEVSSALAVVPESPVVVDELLRAVYAEDFRRLCERVGFAELRRLREHALTLVAESASSFSIASSARFSVVPWRVFKTAARVDDCAEDYGHIAVFAGSACASASSSDSVCGDVYELDRDFRFPRGTHVRVDGNTAQLLRQSWLRRVFTVAGDHSTHIGAFVAGSLSSSSSSVGV